MVFIRIIFYEYIFVKINKKNENSGVYIYIRVMKFTILLIYHKTGSHKLKWTQKKLRKSGISVRFISCSRHHRPRWRSYPLRKHCSPAVGALPISIAITPLRKTTLKWMNWFLPIHNILKLNNFEIQNTGIFSRISEGEVASVKIMKRELAF